MIIPAKKEKKEKVTEILNRENLYLFSLKDNNERERTSFWLAKEEWDEENNYLASFVSCSQLCSWYFFPLKLLTFFLVFFSGIIYPSCQQTPT